MRVLLAVLLVGIAGCGGEDNSPGDVAAPASTASSPVKAENAEAGAAKATSIDDLSDAELADLLQALTEEPADQNSDDAAAKQKAATKKSVEGRAPLTLKGHTDVVNSVSVSPDGKRIVSGGGDKTLKVWDVQTAQETLTLKGHSGYVSSVSFSPDGKRIVSGGSDGTLKVWESETGRETLTLKGATEEQLAAATATAATLIKGHSGFVFSVSFSPDGKQIVSGGLDKTLKIWDISSVATSK